jgi:hypothetical protein
VPIQRPSTIHKLCAAVLAAFPDLADPWTKGQRPEDFEQTLAFSEGLFQLAAADPVVHKLLFEVLQLLKPRSALNDPDLVERVKAVQPSVGT